MRVRLNRRTLTYFFFVNLYIENSDTNICTSYKHSVLWGNNSYIPPTQREHPPATRGDHAWWATEIFVWIFLPKCHTHTVNIYEVVSDEGESQQPIDSGSPQLELQHDTAISLEMVPRWQDGLVHGFSKCYCSLDFRT